MSPCDEVSLKALRYLEDRLQGQELDDFRAHLGVCSNCRTSVETERALSQLLDRTRPLYSAPPALRAQVAAAVEQHSASIGARENFYERLLCVVGSGFADPVRRVARLRLLAATLAVAALVLAFVPHAVRQVHAANYVETAAATHRNYLDGNLALGVRSDSPEEVTAWCTGKVPSVSIAAVLAGQHTHLPARRGQPAELPRQPCSPGSLRKAERENQPCGCIKSVCSCGRRGGSPFRQADVSLPDRRRL